MVAQLQLPRPALDPHAPRSAKRSVAADDETPGYGILRRRERPRQARDPFTSTLGAGGFALLSELNARPLGQVMGVSVQQVGWQYLPGSAQWGGNVFCSLDAVSDAWEDARQRAFDAMTQEARALGADAVVAVRLQRGTHDWARGTVDYLVSGTAIRFGSQAAASGPVLSDLSGQEYWKLLAAGWGPSGLVAATSGFFIAQSALLRWRRRLATTRNQELTEFSRGFSAAREAVVDRLRRQVRACGAVGVIGLSLEHEVVHDTVRVGIEPQQQRIGLNPGTVVGTGAHLPSEALSKRDGIVVTIQAAGTAIRRAQRPARPMRAMTMMRLGASLR